MGRFARKLARFGRNFPRFASDREFAPVELT